MEKTIREVYGEALAECGKHNSDIVVLDADVSSSTKSAEFAKFFPDRFFNVGIAEANMVAMAAGMASAGKIPFVNTFGVFLSTIGLLSARTFGSYSKLPIKMVGAYGGMSDSFDGPSHHSLEDIAIMRSLPNFQVFVPCDAEETKWVVANAVADPVPMYLRMTRNSFPKVYEKGELFESGKGKVIREGQDATVIACGLMVGRAVEAAEILSKEGIEISVIDMFCIKPIDKDLILKYAEKTKRIVSAEEHNVFGGLGSAIAEVLATSGINATMRFVGVNDVHGESGSYEDLQKKYNFSAEAIIREVQNLAR